MTKRNLLVVVATASLLFAACGDGGTGEATPGATAAASVSPSPSVIPGLVSDDYGTMTAKPMVLKPAIDLSTVGGPGEGALNIIIWAGYAMDGSDTNAPEYDWVKPFEAATGCKVESKLGNTSDEMVTLLRQGGGTVYDGVSASGDASNRLIAAGDVAEIDPTTIPGMGDVQPFLLNAPHYVVGGKFYGTPHGWGGNLLMYRTDKVSPPPASWRSVFEGSSLYPGKVTAYDSPIYIADAALYLKAHKPELGITDPYELTAEQLAAAVDLLKVQQPNVGKYWALFSDEIDNFKTGTSIIGTAWPYQYNALKAEGVKVAATVPNEGMTGWADTWMMSAKAAHPNCMKKWMAWMLTPEVQAQVAEYFGEAPANPKACQYLDATYGSYGLKDFCTAYKVNDASFYGKIAFWKTPLPDCGDERGQTCTDYSEWTTKWTEIRG